MTRRKAPRKRFGPAVVDSSLLEQRRLMLVEWNRTEVASLKNETLPELFEEQAKKTPDAVAVVYEEEQISYGELNERANRLAHLLIAKGIKPEDVVGIAVERSPEMVVGLLGILKAGGAYLPLDPEYPVQRLAFMLEDAEPVCVLSTGKVASRLTTDRVRILLDEADTIEALERSATHNPEGSERVTALTPQNPAYVIYTSGSTGTPKGVVITHEGIPNLAGAQAECLGVTSHSRILQFSSLSFDASAWEIVMALTTGAALVLITEEARGGIALRDEIVVRGVTHATLSPAVLATFDGSPEFSLENLVVAGEVCSRELVVQWAARRRMINAYGPTETTVCATMTGPLEELEIPPIGRPIWNTRVYVLDEDLEPVPVGVAGELYIAGAGLARGYLKRPALTAERFVADAYGAPGTRMYRTGDLARWRADGNLEFLGRVDDQVKIRGFRVEPGEVEGVLRRRPEIVQCAVVVREDRAGEKRLVGYVVLAPGKSADVAELRRYVGEQLPDYMVPAAVMVLEAFPLTANGKLDRKALPAPDYSARGGYRAPRTPEEEILCGLFAEVLGLERVGIDDNFFELGGHSLLVTRLVSRIRAILGVEVAIRTVFEAPSVAQLEVRLRVAKEGRVRLELQARPGRLPLSYAQRRLWFIDRLEGGSTEYNVEGALRLRGELDCDALERAIQTIVERHESLRTHFVEVDGEPVQIIESTLRVEVPLQDLSGLEEATQREQVKEALRREGSEPFDLSSGPLVRVKLLRVGEREHILLRTMHHIVTDGWSEGIFNRELMELYEAFREGKGNPLKPLAVQYADFALWQREWLDSGVLDEGLCYWKEQLAGMPERLELPTDRARPAVRTFGAEVCQLSVAEELTTALRRLSQENQATLYMTLLSALAVVFSRYSGQDDIVMGSPIANRQDAQLEGMIGFFVNSLVMRVRLKKGISFRELMREVRQAALEAYRYQDIPFERLVEELSPERNLNTTPIFQVVFALQNTPWAAQQLKGLEAEPEWDGDLKVRFDLEVHAWEHEGRVWLDWVYNRDLFDRWRVEQMARHYMRVLEAVAADADRAIGQLDLLTAGERRQLLQEWNETGQEITRATLPELFEEQAKKTPDAVAVVYEEEQISYGELNERANRLAHLLIAKGIKPEDVVGIAVERSPEMVVGLLGILKAGGAYLPLDPEYPVQRLAFMLEDAEPVCVLSTGEVASRLTTDRVRILLDEADTIEALERSATHNPEGSERVTALTPQNPAYVIYTSGSTGTPKGVVITHRNAERLFRAIEHQFRFNQDDVWTLFHSYAFDFSVWEIWGSFLHGGRLVIVPYLVSRSPVEFLELLVNQAVTVLNQTPTAFYELIQANQREAVLGSSLALRYIVFGGEALDLWRLGDWHELHADKNSALVNMYGITEATVHASYFALEQGTGERRNSTIGRAIPDLRIYALDSNLEPVPVGVAGELYIAGAGLARGYLKRPALTAERFVADAYGAPGTRMYRTGDLARWRADGNLEFLGRVDDQVKIRGFRVELGEVEENLKRHDRVEGAVAIIQGEEQERRLVAYVVARISKNDRINRQNSRIREWQQLYETTYNQPNEVACDFNTVGWNSSYTGSAIPSDEMRIWIEETVSRVRSFEPQTVLEIGCGTGLLLLRLAAHCENYVGVDFSAQVLSRLRTHLSKSVALKHVELRQGMAHDLSFAGNDSVDLVIINSVLQYFPDVDYLLRVLREATRVTRHGGHIFVGDVRSLPLLDAYHTSVQLYKADDTMRVDQLRQTVREAIRKEEELVVAPKLFEELGRRWDKVGGVEICLKCGAYDNELSRFRYDVVMRIGKKEEVSKLGHWVNWDQAGHWRQRVALALLQRPGMAVGVSRLRDRRVGGSIDAFRLLCLESGDLRFANHLRTACAVSSGDSPDEVKQLAQELGVGFCWQRFNEDGLYDVVFNPRWVQAARLSDLPDAYYRKYANSPAAIDDAGLASTLQDYLREQLPDYMVPAAVMVLEAFPLTANGKLDRKALPAPDYSARGGYRAPRTPEEEILCGLFAEVLGLERVGIDDNFFELGGHSLLATRLVNQMATVFAVEIDIRTLFELPRVQELARKIVLERVSPPPLANYADPITVKKVRG